MKILVTAFGPFGPDAENSSLNALSALPEIIGEDTVVKAVLPVVFGRCGEVIRSLMFVIRPDAVVSLGQAAGRDSVTPELIAKNVRNCTVPDNEGQIFTADTIARDGAPQRSSTLPSDEIVGALTAAGIPAKISDSAGTYVCNDLMYSLLGCAAVPAGFIHLPVSDSIAAARKIPVPHMDQKDIDRAVLIAVKTVLGSLRGK